ncbi:MAG: SGNH/GDSL hydrolase family protein [Candidatus Nanopelagicales bacterium]
MAVGDSFTEGLDDEGPQGTFRGWADRFAERAAAAAPGLTYANLAVRGKKIDQVIDEQVPAAVELQPDLTSLAAGINDAMRPSVDLGRVAQRLAEGVEALRASGSQVLLTCVGDPARRSMALRALARRINAYDEHVRRIADEYGCYLMDFWGVALFDDPRCWSVDRLHLSEIGHARVASAAWEAVGGEDDGWREPLPPSPGDNWLAARGRDAQWAWTHLGPWVGRRLRGVSSGDGLQPKRPQLAPVALPAG